MFVEPDENPKTRWPTYQPMALAVLAVATGIFVDRTLKLHWIICLSTACLSLVGWYACWHRTKNQTDGSTRSDKQDGFLLPSTFLLIGLICIAGFWHHGRWNWFGVNEIGRFAKSVSTPCCVEASVVSEPRTMVSSTELGSEVTMDEIRTKLAVRVTRIRDGAKWRPACGISDLVIHAQTNHVRTGDQIRVFGRLVASSPPSNPGQFDFQEFYRAKSRLAFLHAYNVESVQVIKPGGWTQARLVSSLRQRLNELTWQFVDKEEAPFASAILLGNREQLARTRKDAFMETGTIHLLAISGLHVGILAGAFFLLFRLGLLGRKKCLLATIAFVIFYAWLVEFRPPVSRAAILVSLFCWGRFIGENHFSFNLLSVAGLIVLLFNPSDLFGLGPQLSFLAVGTLTFASDWIFWPPSTDPIKRLIASTRPWHVRTINWLGAQFRTAILVSAMIWVVAVPLVAFRFHLIAPIALVVNPLLLIPIAWGLYGGLGVLIFGWFLSPIAKVCGWFCDRNLALIESLIHLAQAIPCGHIWTAGPPWWSVCVFYVGVFLFAIYPLTKLPGRWIATLACLWLAFGWLGPDLIGTWEKRNGGNPLVCTFVDVGHGSSVLLQLPDGKNVLYDAGAFGSASYGARNIAGVLWAERIEHIDAVVLSHGDVDHFNALPQLAEQFSIGVVYVSPQMLASRSSSVVRLLDQLDRLRIQIRVTAAGDQLLSDPTTKIEVLGPPVHGTGGNDNSNSVVLAIEHAEVKVLLPGDLERAGLELLLEQQPTHFDLVMAAHHGSKNSQPVEFMQWANPDFVVISGGSQRVSDKSTEVFQAKNRTVARTDRDGAVRFVVDQDGVQFRKWNSNPW
ncbi:MAG: ComEC/Rec2 family competence protein [Mariniblastus sp.]